MEAAVVVVAVREQLLHDLVLARPVAEMHRLARRSVRRAYGLDAGLHREISLSLDHGHDQSCWDWQSFFASG